MGQLSPREYLKSRRPERFSDTVSIETPILDRGQLEYHLETLTNRGEENVFETFARRLLEKTVCPNLLPHTGPTGGGDSKVDTETYPVARVLSLGWFVGVDSEGSKERWGFAFSAKRDWKPKLSGDIAKIVKTKRGYKKAFFVTNQYVPDRERAKVEDGLRKKHRIDVRVFDRGWILDRVFQQRLEHLAVDELRLATVVRKDVRKGPLDVERELELEKIEQRIAEDLQSAGPSVGTVEAAINAIHLVRELERPRVEVEGLCARAQRLSKEAGTTHQQILTAYEIAWTQYWWYEDFGTYLDSYEVFERLVCSQKDPYELELWSNLFHLLHTAVVAGRLDAIGAELSRRERTLRGALTVAASETGAVSASLQARTHLALIDLVVGKPAQRDTTLRRLADIVREADGFIGYPLLPVTEIIIELGSAMAKSSAYDKLFELIVHKTSTREGEIAAARVLLTRGAQQLDAGQPYEAIRSVGRALGSLYKHETQTEMITALYLCARAYERVGLVWAARGTILAAASLSVARSTSGGAIPAAFTLCVRRMKWIEYRLGRLPQLLSWHELDLRLGALAGKQNDAEWVEEHRTFDAALGTIFLQAEVQALRDFESLPEALERIGLPMASVALLYALGHETKLPAEFLEAVRAEYDGGADLTAYFKSWTQYSEKDAVRRCVTNDASSLVSLSSRILGCDITATTPNVSPCLEIGESILAAAEAFLSTASPPGVVPAQPVLPIRISVDDQGQKFLAVEPIRDAGLSTLKVSTREFNPHTVSPDEQGVVKEDLFQIVTQIIAQGFILADSRRTLKELVRHELAPQRALDFTSSFVVLGNVLGPEPKLQLTDWTAGCQSYPTIRESEWDAVDRVSKADAAGPRVVKYAKGDADVPADLADLSRVGHHQMTTISIFRIPLWNEARWTATAFATDPQGVSPPVLAPVFADEHAAAEIFRLWAQELAADSATLLRVTIIRCISRKRPHDYRVVLASDMTSLPAGATHAVAVSRSNTMTPNSSENLERFLSAYAVHGSYVLAHAILRGDGFELRMQHGLVRSDLVVRDAWEIGRNDPDRVGLRFGDDPIIPRGMKAAPVQAALQELSRSKRKKQP